MTGRTYVSVGRPLFGYVRRLASSGLVKASTRLSPKGLPDCASVASVALELPGFRYASMPGTALEGASDAVLRSACASRTGR